MDATVERDVSEKLLMLQFIFYVAFAKNDSSSPTHMDMELLRRRVAQQQQATRIKKLSFEGVIQWGHRPQLGKQPSSVCNDSSSVHVVSL